MEYGGTVIVTIPPLPYRCPPGPYKRASLIAYYLKRSKPRSKVLILDANGEFAKQPLFEEGWASLYPDMIERIERPAEIRHHRQQRSQGLRRGGRVAACR